jgi:hypothetical protein
MPHNASQNCDTGAQVYRPEYARPCYIGGEEGGGVGGGERERESARERQKESVIMHARIRMKP